MLWWWIVGLADLMVHCKSGEFEHNEEIEKCNDEVFNLHPSKQNQQYAEAALDGQDYKERDLFSSVQQETQNQEIGTIMIEDELRLMLLRHWTLFDSVQNSNYLVSKLATNQEHGQQKFKKFLAMIGVPIDQAKQKYQYMDPQLRKELKKRIIDQTSEFGIDQIITSSYVRQATESM